MVTKTIIRTAVLKLKNGFEAAGFKTKFLYLGHDTWAALKREIYPERPSNMCVGLEIVIVEKQQWLAVGVVL